MRGIPALHRTTASGAASCGAVMRVTIALTLLAAFALGAFGPALDAAPVKPQTAQDRFNRATEQMCGSENAAWEEVAPGVVQCFTHRGSKTIKTRTTP